MVKVSSISPSNDPIEGVTEAIPLIVPVFLWEILVLQAEEENCSPGEVLDRAVCQYLDENGGERAKALKLELEKRQGQ
jgi:hypothetical protein